jgi:RNA polymerase sigma-70 factor (ECF subfamily)
MAAYTDSELLSQFQKEETKNYAFRLIVQKYQEKVYLHIRKLVIDHDDANDIVQNTFVKAWSGLENFREDSQLFTWLYRIATNEALTFLKRKRTRFFLPLVDVEAQLANMLETDPYFNGDEAELKLQKALLTLPEKQRVVFNLRYFDELSYEEMSKILGTSVGALKASYHLAAKKIEKYLEAD